MATKPTRTQRHFDLMCEIVSNMAEAAVFAKVAPVSWDYTCPTWADENIYHRSRDYAAMCHAAEAFMLFGAAVNPRFNRELFLQKVGLK